MATIQNNLQATRWASPRRPGFGRDSGGGTVPRDGAGASKPRSRALIP